MISMKKIIANLLALITVSPVLFLNSSVLAQERNFKSSCGYEGTGGVDSNWGERGKCQIKTYVKGDYLIVEVTTSWFEGEKHILRLENDPSCDYWSSIEGNGCKGGYWGGGDQWDYVTAGEDKTSFGFSLGNAYMFSYDGPLLRPTNQSSNQKQASSNSDNACMSTVKQTANQIYDYGASVNVMASKGASNRKTGNPTNRDISLFINLGASFSYDDSVITLLHGSNNTDRATDDILNSYQLQQNWADNIVEKCSDVAEVMFAQDQSGYSNQYAIQPNGQTELRGCLAPGEPASNDPWNYTYCN